MTLKPRNTLMYSLCFRTECVACGQTIEECKSNPCWFRTLGKLDIKRIIGKEA